MTSKNKQTLFKLTKKDFKISYYRGPGNGGQKKNKTSSGCRIYHEASKAEGKCHETRSQSKNRQIAFKRLCNSDKFKKWLKLECARKTGALDEVEKYVENELKTNVITEIHDENGKWKKINKLEELDNEGQERNN